MTTSTNGATISHPIGPDGTLAVRFADWSVDIVGTDGHEARVRNADGGPLPAGVEIDRGDGSLRISQPTLLGRLGLGIVLGSGRGDVRLAIEVPAAAGISAQSASGDVTTRGLTGSQQVRSASGDVRVFAASGEVVAESVSGDASVDLDGRATVTAKTVSGDARVEGGTVERLAIVTTSGNIRVGSPLEAGSHSIATLSGDVLIAAGSGVRVHARTVSGDLSSDLPHRSEGGPGRRSIVIGNGAAEIQFKSVSGDLRVVGRDPGDRAFAIPVETRPDRVEPTTDAPAQASAPASEDAAGEARDDAEAARLAILRQLERGEIDVAEATARLTEIEDR